LIWKLATPQSGSYAGRDRRSLARTIAKLQKAALFQLKAAIDIAEAGDMGKPERGLKSLRDLCANLPEGFDAPQLAEARRLLSA
jgi:hypothetical protein